MTADLQKATLDGLNAKVGDRNPYTGQGVAATAWMLGYKTMLRKQLEGKPDDA